MFYYFVTADHFSISMLCIIGLTCRGRDQATHFENKTFSSCYECIFSMFCSQPAFHGILCLSVLAMRLCLIQNAENKTELVPESISSRNSEGWTTLTALPYPLLLPLFYFCFVFCCCSMALLQLPATPKFGARLLCFLLSKQTRGQARRVGGEEWKEETERMQRMEGAINMQEEKEECGF